MAWLMAVSWGALFVILVLAILQRFVLKKEKIKKYADSLIGICLMIAIPSTIVAIATKDPILEFFGISTMLEWWINTIALFFVAWWYYFNPLKSRVVQNEKDIVGLKKDIGSLKTETRTLKNDLDSKFNLINSDLHLIKEKLFNN